LAWQRHGSGPTVVAIPPTVQNIEVAWEWPRLRDMFDRFGSFSDWVQFDKRGSGASDRRSDNPGIDERVEDLRAVMDAAEVERAFLYGASEGGPTCLLFAATYPHRVDGLILHGTGPYSSPQGLEGAELAQLMGIYQEMANRFGTSESYIVDHFAPSIADEPGYREWHSRYQRLSATRDSLMEILEISLSVDVSEILHEIDAPTLVLHATGDRIVPVDYGRLLAREIENAELHEYDSQDHFGYTDLGWVDAMERFVTGGVAERPPAPKRGRASIQTLGHFRVVVDGVEVPNSAWGSHRSRQLCKRLVAARGWPVRREELFDLLWPDEDDYAKLGPRLSVQLSAVRRVLGGGVIADRQTVALNLDEVTTDLELLLSSDDPDVALFDGDFLVGDIDEPWTVAIRDEARARFTNLAHERLAIPIRSNEALARKLVALDPWDERAHLAHDAYAAAMTDLGVEASGLEEIIGS
jgi:pimeloyl-ACP methyl ester carboxylesterase